MFRYPIIIEKSKKNYSAYSPDLPGCVATGATPRETLAGMKSAIKFHLEGLRKKGARFSSRPPRSKI